MRTVVLQIFEIILLSTNFISEYHLFKMLKYLQNAI